MVFVTSSGDIGIASENSSVCIDRPVWIRVRALALFLGQLRQPSGKGVAESFTLAQDALQQCDVMVVDDVRRETTHHDAMRTLVVGGGVHSERDRQRREHRI